MEKEKRFKPTLGERYYALNICGISECLEFLWEDDYVDKNYYKNHNCFPTRELAEQKLSEIKTLLK